MKPVQVGTYRDTLIRRLDAMPLEALEALKESAREDATTWVADAEVLADTVLIDLPESVRMLTARAVASVVSGIAGNTLFAVELREALLDELAMDAALVRLAEREA
jgi:hypothetical protein